MQPSGPEAGEWPVAGTAPDSRGPRCGAPGLRNGPGAAGRTSEPSFAAQSAGGGRLAPRHVPCESRRPRSAAVREDGRAGPWPSAIVSNIRRPVPSRPEGPPRHMSTHVHGQGLWAAGWTGVGGTVLLEQPGPEQRYRTADRHLGCHHDKQRAVSVSEHSCV